jgi:hypothetical protein
MSSNLYADMCKFPAIAVGRPGEKLCYSQEKARIEARGRG